jgi:hypothetical protein
MDSQASGSDATVQSNAGRELYDAGLQPTLKSPERRAEGISKFKVFSEPRCLIALRCLNRLTIPKATPYLQIHLYYENDSKTCQLGGLLVGSLNLFVQQAFFEGASYSPLTTAMRWLSSRTLLLVVDAREGRV